MPVSETSPPRPPNPHTLLDTGSKRAEQTLMIPNKKRAQQLDETLRVLGFHARASGKFSVLSKKGVRSSAQLSDTDRQQSMAERVEASRKRPGTADDIDVVAAGR